ncbi:MAG: TonB-dependent receptor [Bacteroidetes bacterium]|nr:TonB-dependent receptor [Bacteroidota bacterium]MBU1720469.1 TonB-dependent receptor [Bacteroidota bacterium]
MRKFRYLLATLIIVSTSIQATAQKHTISGYVREKGSRELLIGVNVYNKKTMTGTVTNNYGFYSLTIPDDSVELVVSYVGYKPFSTKLFLEKDVIVDAELNPALELDEVEISAERQEKVSETTRMSVVELPVIQVKEIPALLGEKDVFKVLQLMPGVQSGSEGSSGLYVRGGGPDQNLIILDDALVYNASHLFGFFSIFNGDALKSIELTKGGFPARYGGRLSSVLEMNMKDGNKDHLSGEAGIGFISSRLTLEGPIIKNKASFLVSARRTYIDAIVRPFMNKDAAGVGGYYFYDLNTKFNYDLDDKNKFYLSGYFGRDKFYFKSNGDISLGEAGLFWQNATATARWNHLFNNRLFSNTSFIFSDYTLKIYIEEKYDTSVFKLSYTSGIQDYGLKYDLLFLPNPSHSIRVGLLSTFHIFTPSAVVLNDSYMGEFRRSVNEIYSLESGLYIEDDINLSGRSKVNAGIRLSHFLNDKRHYITPEPRISATYIIQEDLSAKASFSRMSQYVHLLSNTGIGLPTDLWVPATDSVQPQQSWQVAAGFAKDFTKKNLSLTIEGYYKKMDHIITYREGASFLLISDPTGADEINWEDNVTSGQGWAYGAEVMLQRKFGKLSGWIGYTLSWTQLQFNEVNFGNKYFAKYDRRHDISVVAIYKINKDITFSTTWVYGTGNAITLPLAEYEAYTHNPIPTPKYEIEPYPNIYGMFVSEYGEKNSFRMKSYHRLDMGLQFHKKLGWKHPASRTFELSVYNLYNRKNPFFYFSDNDETKTVLKQVALFPMIPSISYTLKF